MGISEIIFILFMVLVLFGADKLPEVARGLGKAMRQVREATNEIKTELTKTAEQGGVNTSIIEDAQQEINKIKDEVANATSVDLKQDSGVEGTVKR
ncbi:Sec-independent protein translocase subunit TatA/TatB [Capnocytophaga haemolytica]